MDTLIALLRATVGDFTNVYDKKSLAKLLTVSAMRVAQVATFTQDFVADILAVEINPDPTDGDTTDVSFQNLVVLQAACILQQQEAKRAAAQSIAVKDGPSSIDTRGASAAIIEIMKSGKSFCDDFQTALYQYYSDSTQVAGAAVMGPIRYMVGGVASSSYRRNAY